MTIADSVIVGERLRKLRKYSGSKTSELVAVLSTTKGHYKDIESGKAMLPGAYYEKLSKHFGVEGLGIYSTEDHGDPKPNDMNLMVMREMRKAGMNNVDFLEAWETILIYNEMRIFHEEWLATDPPRRMQLDEVSNLLKSRGENITVSTLNTVAITLPKKVKGMFLNHKDVVGGVFMANKKLSVQERKEVYLRGFEHVAELNPSPELVVFKEKKPYGFEERMKNYDKFDIVEDDLYHRLLEFAMVLHNREQISGGRFRGMGRMLGLYYIELYEMYAKKYPREVIEETQGD